jgi:hypothetical protein
MRLDDFFLVIGIDTEYARETALDAVDKAGNPFARKKSPERNNVLCYSYSVLNPRTGRKASGILNIHGAKHSNRIALSSLIGRVLSEAEATGLVDSPGGKLPVPTSAKDFLKVALVGHFSRADLPGFRDFNKLKKRFDAARGTFVSIERPSVMTARLPSTRSVQVSVHLFDTKLQSPAGYGALADLGGALNFPKLSLPDVQDEAGETIRGITRMDIVRARHPADFVRYAKRDAEVAVEWFCQFARFCAGCGVRNVSPTIGAAAVSWLKTLVPAIDLADTLGRQMDGRKITAEFVPQALAIQGMAADAFLGGRNECFGVGLYGPDDSAGRPFWDFDLKGAYTTSAVFFRPIDWENIEIGVKDISRLAVLDRPTLATVEFSFPPGTRFPSLSVDAGDYGLIHPLKGVTTATGPALVVALNQGAAIKVLNGVVLDWIDPNAARPFLRLVQGVNKARKAAGKGTPHELLAKEAGNSVYGKTGQGVSAMKTNPVVRRLFSTREGVSKPLGPSGITSPLIAAYISGTCRAVLSEILANLPDHVTVLSATTDGWLSTATEDEARAAASGPVATHFSQLRAMADPANSPEIIEPKHAAERVLSVKTRGAFTVGAPLSIDQKAPGKHIMARAGHRLDRRYDDKAAEVAAWLDLHASREFETDLGGIVFKSLREQWEHDADLIDVLHRARVNFDFDMKRRPVNVRDGADGLVQFATEAWETVDEFVEWRRAFDRWRETCRACLKTAADWAWFSAWRDDPRRASHARRTPFQQALMIGMAMGLIMPLQPRGRRRSKVGVTLKGIAELLTEAGIVGATPRTLEHARDRETDPTGTAIAGMSRRDFDTLDALSNVLEYRLIDPENGDGFGIEITKKTTENEISFESHGAIIPQSKNAFGKSLRLKVLTGKVWPRKSNPPKPVGGERAFGGLLFAPETASSEGAPAPVNAAPKSAPSGHTAGAKNTPSQTPDLPANSAAAPASPSHGPSPEPIPSDNQAPVATSTARGAEPLSEGEPVTEISASEPAAPAARQPRSEEEIMRGIREAARAKYAISDLQLRRGRAAAAKMRDVPARSKELAAISFAIEKKLQVSAVEALRLLGELAIETAPPNGNNVSPAHERISDRSDLPRSHAPAPPDPVTFGTLEPVEPTNTQKVEGAEGATALCATPTISLIEQAARA